MSKKLLLGIIIVLLITNISSLFLWNSGEGETRVSDDDNNEGLNTEDVMATVNGEEITHEAWMKALRNKYGEQELWDEQSELISVQRTRRWPPSRVASRS